MELVFGSYVRHLYYKVEVTVILDWEVGWTFFYKGWDVDSLQLDNLWGGMNQYIMIVDARGMH